MSGETLRGWSGVLALAPDFRLLLKAAGLGEESARRRLTERLRAAGVDPARVDFHGRTAGTAEHLATYGLVDVALDTFPYHGTTTTCEALWMGVPVLRSPATATPRGWGEPPGRRRASGLGRADLGGLRRDRRGAGANPTRGRGRSGSASRRDGRLAPHGSRRAGRPLRRGPAPVLDGGADPGTSGCLTAGGAAIPRGMSTILLLFCSNVFMTFAWYGHLKYGRRVAALEGDRVSWAVALIEYCLAVPANRLGYTRFPGTSSRSSRKSSRSSSSSGLPPCT